MQSALCIPSPTLPLTSKTLPKPVAVGLPSKSFAPLTCRARSSGIKASPATSDLSTVDYSSAISVFPAEACETIGGDACLADIYPEVRLAQDARTIVSVNTEALDREYLDYNNAKTVFPAEACDDLGGEFCERPYQRGVY